MSDEHERAKELLSDPAAPMSDEDREFIMAYGESEGRRQNPRCHLCDAPTRGKVEDKWCCWTCYQLEYNRITITRLR